MSAHTLQTPPAANDAAHPNLTALNLALGRWIREAASLPNPIAALESRIEWLQRQSAILSGPGQTPAHLEGLGAWDLNIAISSLAGAVNAYRRAA